MSTIAALNRAPASTPFVSAIVSACNVARHTLRITVELHAIGCTVATSKLTTPAGAKHRICPCWLLPASLSPLTISSSLANDASVIEAITIVPVEIRREVKSFVGGAESYLKHFVCLSEISDSSISGDAL